MINRKNHLPTIPEYEGNPFIAALPPLPTQAELVHALASRPEIGAKERDYPAHLRKHCIMRLSRYFEPLERQIQLAERFDMLLRQGYLGRNPLTHDYMHHLHNGLERIDACSLEAPTLHNVENTAMSFALTGCSGIGKSKSMEKVLHQYRQCILHSEPITMTQITWLKLDCPFHGSPKQLCISFFAAVDKLLGTQYLKWYGHGKTNIDEMMVHMAHIANLHALGVLVIDEIQHLNHSKIGSEALLNFLVTLVNTIGVPIILIGTLSAVPLLQQNFRQARRANGLGSLNWDRMLSGKSWNHFIDKLWSYQWTREVTPISPEIRDALYDESQGILDVVVKIFMLTQLRLVGIGEIRGIPEVITPNLIRNVAREDFAMIRPMINALRKNDLKALLKFDDLLPLQTHVDQVIASALLPSERNVPPAISETVENASVGDDLDDSSSIRIALRNAGIANDVVETLLADAFREYPSRDPLLIMAKIVEQLSVQSVKRSKRSTKPQEPIVRPAFDLRNIVAAGKQENRLAYDALLSAKVIKLPIEEFVA